MNITESVEKFLEFEDKNNLFGHKIKGVKWWEYSRFRIFYNIIENKQEIIGNSGWNELPKSEILKIPFRLLKNSILKNPLFNIKKSDVLVLLSPWRVKTSQGYEEYYLEGTIKNMPFSSFVLEHVDLNGNHTITDFSKQIKFLDIFTLIKVLLEPFLPGIYRSNAGLRKVLSELEQMYDYKFDKKFIRYINQYLKYLIIEIKLFLPFYKYILKKVNPKVLLETNSYFMVYGVINKAAKELGIKVVELQHGTMGKYHIAYNFKKQFKIDSFPDYIFLFGDFWKTTTRFPIQSQNLLTVGFPFYEKQFKEFAGTEKKYKGQRIILFVSQGPISKHLSRFAAALAKIIDKSKFHIIYKLHPHENPDWESATPWLESTGIEVISDTKANIFYYYRQADFQVCVYSTAIYEGLGFGLKTFILKLYGYEFVEDLRIQGYVKLVESPEELNVELNNDDFSGMNTDLENIWKMNSPKNTFDAIKSLM